MQQSGKLEDQGERRQSYQQAEHLTANTVDWCWRVDHTPWTNF